MIQNSVQNYLETHIFSQNPITDYHSKLHTCIAYILYTTGTGRVSMYLKFEKKNNCIFSKENNYLSWQVNPFVEIYK